MTSKPSLPFNPLLTDENKGHIIVIIAAIFTALITITTGTRILVKLWQRTQLGTEDYCMIMCLAMNLVGNGTEFQAVKRGFGRHLQFLTIEQQRSIRMWSQLSILFANLALWAVKISIALFILRLIRGAHPRSRWIVYGLMAITSTAHACQIVFWATQAQPLKKIWQPEIPGKISSMRSMVNIMITFTALSSMLHLFYALSPVYFFGALKIERRRKFIIIGLTGSGLLVFVASISRLAFINDFFKPDFSWDLRRVYICSIVERNLAEIIADLPAIFPLVNDIHKKARSALSPKAYSASRARTSHPYRPGLLTIGSNDKHGNNMQTNITHKGSDDEIPLREQSHQPTCNMAGSLTENRGIMVQVDIVISSDHKEGDIIQSKDV